MHKNTSKQNPIASDVHFSNSRDKKKRKLENIHQHNISCLRNAGVHDFIKLNKKNTHLYTDLIEQGEI